MSDSEEAIDGRKVVQGAKKVTKKKMKKRKKKEAATNDENHDVDMSHDAANGNNLEESIMEVTLLPFVEVCICKAGHLTSVIHDVAYMNTSSSMQICILNRELDKTWKSHRLSVNYQHTCLERPTFTQVVMADHEFAVLVIEYGGQLSSSFGGLNALCSSQILLSFYLSTGEVIETKSLPKNTKTRQVYFDVYTQSIWIAVHGESDEKPKVLGYFKRFQQKNLESMENWKHSEVRRPMAVTTNCTLMAVDESKQYVIVFQRESDQLLYGIDFRAWSITLTPDNHLVTLGTNCVVVWKNLDGVGVTVFDNQFPSLITNMDHNAEVNTVQFICTAPNTIMVRETILGCCYALYSIELMLQRLKTNERLKYVVTKNDTLATTSVNFMKPFVHQTPSVEKVEADDNKVEPRPMQEENKVDMLERKEIARRPAPEKVDASIRCRCFERPRKTVKTKSSSNAAQDAVIHENVPIPITQTINADEKMEDSVLDDRPETIVEE